VRGVFHCLQAGCNAMTKDGKGGVIINLASIASLVRRPPPPAPSHLVRVQISFSTFLERLARPRWLRWITPNVYPLIHITIPPN
jgi:NAD(P)-dependent dehydrogenase (short-subunit alcohol dehydrogenase family)